MAKSNITAIFQSDIKKVWAIITSLENYSWRSDISKIEVIKPDSIFVEYTLSNYPTTFTITKFEPYKQYEFDMENTKMCGHWIGIITETSTGTMIDFTEDVTAKNLILKPFVKSYLKKQQALYVSDLKKALCE